MFTELGSHALHSRSEERHEARSPSGSSSGRFLEPGCGRVSDELGAWSMDEFEDDGLFMVREHIL
jgi:hypothetical protein